MTEFDFIRTLKKIHPLPWENSVGNDCAFFKLKSRRGLITKDLLIEGHHFYSDIPLDALAYKSLAVNLSDIISDGGKPLAFLVGLGASPAHEALLPPLFTALYKYAKQWDIPIIGGDTIYSEKLLLSITCLGESPKKPWLRKNARLDDFLYLTGKLGSSAWGLKKIARLGHDLNDADICRHLYPPLYLEIPKILKGKVHAAMDISDGFIQDLTHLLVESAQSALLFPDKLPISDTLPPDEVSLALNGGEDYEILFTSPLDLDHFKWTKKLKGIKLHKIGKIISGNPGKIFLPKDGKLVLLTNNEFLKGFDHWHNNGSMKTGKPTSFSGKKN